MATAYQLSRCCYMRARAWAKACSKVRYPRKSPLVRAAYLELQSARADLDAAMLVAMRVDTARARRSVAVGQLDLVDALQAEALAGRRDEGRQGEAGRSASQC